MGKRVTKHKKASRSSASSNCGCGCFPASKK